MDTADIHCWREADRLYACWLDLPEPERADWLARQKLEANVQTALLRLIAQQDSRDETLPGVAGLQLEQETARNQLAGRHVGHWELLEEIGRGGMSVVYRARRTGVDFEQYGAIKLLALAALGSEGSARFEQERRLLARLNHPLIAALVDGGFAADGTPFLVMNLIEGVTLARHCEQARLPWQARVDLVRQICDAVAHAHSKLLVHRDLKPSNILVTPEGVPMLLDFGIAKLLDDKGDTTRTALRAHTPGYGAPEQLAGGEITTATDVYSLGVVLRELCAPFGMLPADLRNIIAMATRETPDRRYPDARALGEDLDRLRLQRPVRATPDSASYRLAAFLRRRRGLVVASASVLLALLTGLGTALWQAQRASLQAQEAQRQALRAEAVRDFLFQLFAAADRERNETADPPVSAVLNRGAVQLQESSGMDAELRAEMAILLGHLNTSAGRYEAADALLGTALEDAQASGNPELLAGAHTRLGILANARGDSELALTQFEAALAQIANLPLLRREQTLVAAMGGWVTAMNNTGKTDAARQRLIDVLAEPGLVSKPALRGELLLAQSIVTPDAPQRLQALQRAGAYFLQEAPTPTLRLTLASMFANTYVQLNTLDEAVRHTQDAAQLVERIYPGTTSQRARAYNNLASIMARANRMQEAEAAYAKAEDIFRALGDDRSPSFASLLHNRGLLLSDLGAADIGLPLLEQAWAMAVDHFGASDTRSMIALRNLAMVRADATGDPRAEQEWRKAYAASDSLSPLQRLGVLISGSIIALRLDNTADAGQRLDEADALVSAHSLTLLPMQRVRLATLRGVWHSQRGESGQAVDQFVEAQTLAAAHSEETWTARWRNHLAFGRHLLQDNPSRAREQFEAALDLLSPPVAARDSAQIRELRHLLDSATAKANARP